MSSASTMSDEERAHHYAAQQPGRPLTPKQTRRMNKKSKKMLVEHYRKAKGTPG